MKKIIFTLIFILTSLYGFSQNDSIQLTTLSDQNAPPADARFYYWYISGSDTFDRNITRQYLMPWVYSGGDLYPYATSYNVGIGNTNPGSYRLAVTGNQSLSGYLTIFGNINTLGKVVWTNSQIYQAGPKLMLYDDDYGSAVSLSDIMGAGGGSYTFLNGLEDDGSGNIGISGSLSQNTTIDAGAYSFTISTSNSDVFDLRNGYGTITADEAYLTGVDRAYIQKGSNKVLVDTALSLTGNGHELFMGTEEFNITPQVDEDLNVTTSGAGKITLYEVDTIYFNDSTYIIEHPSEGWMAFFSDDVLCMEVTTHAGGIAEVVADGQFKLGNIASASESEGVFWYNSADDSLYFHDGNGWTNLMRTGSGSGDVSISGTPTKGQIALWSDATTILGKDSLKWEDGMLILLGKNGRTSVGYNNSDNGTGTSSFGYNANAAITEGNYNTSVGQSAGSATTTGSSNTNLGYNAGSAINTENGCVNLGKDAGSANTNESNVLYIENSNANKFSALIWGDFANDSLRLNAYTIIKDTFDLEKVMTFKTNTANSGDTCWGILKPHGSGYGWTMDTATITFGASWATMIENIGEFEVFFTTRDPETDEWNWERWKHDKGCFELSKHLRYTVAQLGIAIEKNFTWDYEVRQRLDSLEIKVEEPKTVFHDFGVDHEKKIWKFIYILIIGISILFVWNIIQQIQIRKLKK